MRILCLSEAFWPDRADGTTKTVFNEVEGLAGLGHSVTVVCRKLNSASESHQTNGKYAVYRYPSPRQGHAFSQTAPFLTMLKLPSLLKRLHFTCRFDQVLVNSLYQAKALLKASLGIPLCYVYHCSRYAEVEIAAAGGKYGARKWLAKILVPRIKALETHVLAEADRIVVRSNFMKEDLLKRNSGIAAGKIHRIPLGVNTQRYSFAEDNAAVRAELGLPSSRPILLTVRQLAARMGLDALVMAMRRVVSRFPEVLLLIGGSGYMEHELRRLIGELNLNRNVVMLGFVPEDKLPKYYQAADLFVLPTRLYEGFGLATIESLACGTPVAATPVGANPEVLAGFEDGLFDGCDQDAIASGLIRWLERGPSISVRRKCREYCADNFDHVKVCKQIEQLLCNAHPTNYDSTKQYAASKSCNV